MCGKQRHDMVNTMQCLNDIAKLKRDTGRNNRNVSTLTSSGQLLTYLKENITKGNVLWYNPHNTLYANNFQSFIKCKAVILYNYTTLYKDIVHNVCMNNYKPFWHKDFRERVNTIPHCHKLQSPTVGL